MRSATLLSLFLCMGLMSAAHADAPGPPADAAAITQIKAEEPLASEFSLTAAARYLDAAAIDWKETHACTACHTMFSYMMARQTLGKVLAPPPDVRTFFEDVVDGRADPMPDYSCEDLGASIRIGVAVSLALDDRWSTGKLSPAARRALDAMWAMQRADGGFDWPFRDAPPIKGSEHYAATLAAIAAGMAPDDYALAEPARSGLKSLRRYFDAHAAETLHDEAMLAWAGAYVPSLADEDVRRRSIDRLLAAQRPDGGWSLASLIENPKVKSAPSSTAAALRASPGHGESFLVYAGPDYAYKSSLASDGYATGLAIFVARQCGQPANDARLVRGVAWFKANQRASGRWFTPSQAGHSHNLIANAGTAYAVMALTASPE
jgi:squalene-hopene/tetraprenyl-beta-curcumene cyclase